ILIFPVVSRTQRSYTPHSRIFFCTSEVYGVLRRKRVPILVEFGRTGSFLAAASLKLLFILSSEANSLQKYKKMNEKLFTQCTSFVLNRWDQIPANNAEQVKQKFGDLNPVKQISISLPVELSVHICRASSQKNLISFYME
ncbi:hypothetical protein pdam_00002456, partial [Pocillopora damicornis]